MGDTRHVYSTCTVRKSRSVTLLLIIIAIVSIMLSSLLSRPIIFKSALKTNYLRPENCQLTSSFFVGAETVASLLQTTQIKQGVLFIAANKVCTSTNKTTIV